MSQPEILDYILQSTINVAKKVKFVPKGRKNENSTKIAFEWDEQC